MSARKKQQVARAQSWGFSGAVILLVGYFAVVNPEAMNPTWVTVIGLLLTAMKTLLGLRGGDDDDDNNDNGGNSSGEEASRSEDQ